MRLSLIGAGGVGVGAGGVGGVGGVGVGVGVVVVLCFMQVSTRELLSIVLSAHCSLSLSDELFLLIVV